MSEGNMSAREWGWRWGWPSYCPGVGPPVCGLSDHDQHVPPSALDRHCVRDHYHRVQAAQCCCKCPHPCLDLWGPRDVCHWGSDITCLFYLDAALCLHKKIQILYHFLKYYLDVKSGILRMWNVSKSTPIENIRIKKTGIHALQTINVEHRSRVKDVRDSQVSSTSPTLTPASTNSSHFVLPPAKIVCAFLDGGVGLYDLGGRKWDFLRDQVSIC